SKDRRRRAVCQRLGPGRTARQDRRVLSSSSLFLLVSSERTARGLRHQGLEQRCRGQGLPGTTRISISRYHHQTAPQGQRETRSPDAPLSELAFCSGRAAELSEQQSVSGEGRQDSDGQPFEGERGAERMVEVESSACEGSSHPYRVQRIAHLLLGTRPG